MFLVSLVEVVVLHYYYSRESIRHCDCGHRYCSDVGNCCRVFSAVNPYGITYSKRMIVAAHYYNDENEDDSSFAYWYNFGIV
jgi:hypothetical protein